MRTRLDKDYTCEVAPVCGSAYAAPIGTYGEWIKISPFSLPSLISLTTPLSPPLSYNSTLPPLSLPFPPLSHSSFLVISNTKVVTMLGGHAYQHKHSYEGQVEQHTFHRTVFHSSYNWPTDRRRFQVH